MLSIHDAKKIFQRGTPNERVALDRLSLALKQGEFVVVLGSNGSGKSTLLNAITGSFLLDSGRIALGETDITWMPSHRRALAIGFLAQDPMKGTAPHMSVEENLSLAYSRRGHGPLRAGVSKKDATFFREKLARFGMGLEDRMKTPAGLLSGGQRQVLALLMSAIGEPLLLLLDEHTAALDPQTARQVMAITESVVREHGITALMVTHNIESALSAGDRTIVMSGGKLALSLDGEARRGMTVEGLVRLYSSAAGDSFGDSALL
jgi:putative ABC transport system ATP-binding protein